MQFVEVRDCVEVPVQDRTVVLGGCDQDRRLAAEEEVMRVIGM